MGIEALTSSDIRKIFGEIIFEKEEPITFISIQNQNDVHHRSTGRSLYYFPEIEELVEVIPLKSLFLEAMDNGKFRLGARGKNVDLLIYYPDENGLKGYIKDIREFVNETKEIIEALKPLYPLVDDVNYTFRSNQFDAEIPLKIGFHKNYIERYVGWYKSLFPEFKYVSQIGFRYIKNWGKNFYIYYGTGTIEIPNVAIIEHRENFEKLMVKLDASKFIELIKEIVNKEMENIKSLWKYLLLV